MRTAISIPDELFAKAERASHELGLSTSELIQRALSAYLASESDDHVTARLDSVYATPGSSTIAPDLLEMQTTVWAREEW